MTAPSEASSPKDPSRRSVLIASAWSVPVVIAVAGLPLAAASTSLEVTPLSGDVTDGHILFEGAATDGMAPLVFEIVEAGAPFNGSVVATLSGPAAGAVEWDPDLHPDGSIVAAVSGDGLLFLPLVVHAPGTVTVYLAIRAQSWTFTVTLTA